MIKRVKKKEETINKLRIYNFFWKPATDPEMGERIEKMGKPINKLRFWNFFLNRKRTQKKEETNPKKNGKRIKCKYSENRPKIFGNPSTLFSFWGISDNSWKNSLLSPFPCWGVSMAPTKLKAVQWCMKF